MKSSVSIETNTQATYHSIKIAMKRKSFQVSILEDGKIQMSQCTCGAQDFCEHFYTAISGKTKLLNAQGIATQKRIISSLVKTEEGRRLLFNAQPIAKQHQSSWLHNQIRSGKEKLFWRLKGWLVNDDLT